MELIIGFFDLIIILIIIGVVLSVLGSIFAGLFIGISSMFPNNTAMEKEDEEKAKHLLTPEGIAEEKIEALKVKAEKLGLPKALQELYFEIGLMYYPSWIDNNKRLNKFLSDLSECKYISRKLDDTIINIVYMGNNYLFHCKTEPNFGDYTSSNYLILSMSFNGEEVFGISITEDVNRYGSNYKLTGTDSFIDGEWVGEFLKLYDYCKKAEASRTEEQDNKVKQTQLEEQKKKFGIKD